MTAPISYDATWKKIKERTLTDAPEGFEGVPNSLLVKALIWKLAELENEVFILQTLQDEFERKHRLRQITAEKRQDA